MEGNGLSGGIYSGMLGLEMPLHPPQQQQQQNPQNPHHLNHHHQQVVAFAHHETDHHPETQQHSVKQSYPFAQKAKQQQQQQLALSDEDEPTGFNGDDGDDKRSKVSPWQRMKWTDSMVRLLIMAVFYIGDEACSEATTDVAPTAAAGKKKSGGLLQKKGKWKSVSKAMMEKGFYVSPQQCEDKFNDLNKRYKRVNDILGKGTACRVVENQSLLDTMDNLTPKMKEEVRKLLNSKHLFFREMCAYHNSCGGGGNGGGSAGGSHHSPEIAAEPSHHHQHHQRCLHSSDNATIAPKSSRTETGGSKMVKGGSSEEDDEDDEDEEDEDEEDEEVVEGGIRVHHHNEHGNGEDDDNDERSSRKRQRKIISKLESPLIHKFNSELLNLIQDGSKNSWEKKQWMKNQLMQLEEQRVGYQYEAFELEKQRLKWVKFSSKKEREMERAKISNEQMKLENERMVLLLRRKELELIELLHTQQHCSNRRGDPSSITG